MIVVIADDITGAAELGGIGLRFGLRVILSNDVVYKPNVDLVVVYTNTRSMHQEEAVEVMTALTKKAKECKPSLFYKKIDSVLRGYVVEETKAQMEVLGYDKALLVPVNPTLGRTIKDGHYYLEGNSIHKSSFSSDPEFPINSSDVKQMLNYQIAVAKYYQPLTKGITIGEAETKADVEEWLRYQNEKVLFGGAASFFYVLLQSRYRRSLETGNCILSKPMLLVSGTTYLKSIEQRASYNHLVSDMPSLVYRSNGVDEDEIKTWAGNVAETLSGQQKAIIAIGQHRGKADSNLLREKLGEVVKTVLQQTEIRELLIEGGSTAYSIIQKLGFSSFIPTEELQQGVVRMKVENKENLHITIKPGSYDWPEEWNFN